MVADTGVQAWEDEEEVYTGTVKKVSAKDPQKFIVECPDTFETYGVHVLLPASKKPDGVSLGDAIRFTVHQSKPLITWAEKAKKKRKAEETQEVQEEAVDVSAETYTGKVTKKSDKQSSLYIVECPVVTQWYGIEARLSERLWPVGLELGGEINFGIKETPSGKPLVAWAEAVERAEPQAKKKKEPVFTPGWTALVEMKDAESAIEAWALDGKEFNGVLLSVVHHHTTEDGRKFKVSGVPPGTLWSDVKAHFKQAGDVGYCRVNSPFAIGEIRFDDPSSAEESLGLYGTVCRGAEIKVELDGRCEDGTKVRIMGLPPGFPSSALLEHFQEVGGISACTVRDVAC
mmetsp:Transcript_62040/g.181302  ORF Transcript_62040/g.181302 Transcript_62040/m.181302 type:complete len:344 (-) Transcript_62040:29-1060(-)